MPYTENTAVVLAAEQQAREAGKLCEKSGELNRILTAACNAYLKGQHNYTKFNEVVGVLECAKQEFYRRMVTPYEDYKKNQNGDVFPSLLLR